MLTSRLKQFEDGYNRLLESIEKENDLLFKNEHQIIRDSIIKRFEFTFELGWKLLKNFLEENGVKAFSPRECIKEAFKMNLITKEEDWLELLKARNLTSHVYAETMAEDIYNKIKQYHFLIKNLINEIKHRCSQIAHDNGKVAGKNFV